MCLLAQLATGAGFSAQPAPCQLPEDISTVPQASGSGFMAAPSRKLKLPLPSHEAPIPVPHSFSPQTVATWPAAIVGTSPLPAGHFQQSLTPLSSLLQPSCPRGLSLQPYFSASVPTTSCRGEGDIFVPKSLLRNKATRQQRRFQTGPCPDLMHVKS